MIQNSNSFSSVGLTTVLICFIHKTEKKRIISAFYIYIFIYQAIQNIEYIKQDWIIFQYKLNSVYTLQLIHKLVC